MVGWYPVVGNSCGATNHPDDHIWQTILRLYGLEERSLIKTVNFHYYKTQLEKSLLPLPRKQTNKQSNKQTRNRKIIAY